MAGRTGGFRFPRFYSNRKSAVKSVAHSLFGGPVDRFPKWFVDFLTVDALILYNGPSRHLSGNDGESFL